VIPVIEIGSVYKLLQLLISDLFFQNLPPCNCLQRKGERGENTEFGTHILFVGFVRGQHAFLILLHEIAVKIFSCPITW